MIRRVFARTALSEIASILVRAINEQSVGPSPPSGKTHTQISRTAVSINIGTDLATCLPHAATRL